MARKKIVFVIVEGPSDDDALGVLLNRWFDKSIVYVHIMHYDVTTQKGVSVSNIIPHITGVIKKYAKDNHFDHGHFKQIIHIADTDGAYILNDCIIEDVTCEELVYHTETITCKNRDSIIERNKQKSENLNRLSLCPYIWNDIPYRAYYMSCNLDHVLYNKLNSCNDDKERNSLAFARRYKDDVNGFVRFISESDFSIANDYKSSWDYIKQDLHSLERHSNLGLCFTEKTE